MEINAERDGDTLILSTEGRVDGGNAREFEEAIKTTLSADDRVVVMDLKELTYISSAGLRAILLTAKDLWKRDAKFALCELSASIKEVVEIAGFDKIIPIHASKTEAVDSLRS